MRIVVLGGTGYLGGKLIQKLVSSNLDVDILCLKRKNSSLENLRSILDKITICEIDDLREYLNLSGRRYDCLINLSCKYLPNVPSDLEVFQSNLFVPLQVFLNCIEHGTKRIISIGTGLPDDFNAYTVSKRKFAELIRQYGDWFYGKGQGLQICNVELENFYGSDEPQNRFLPGTVRRLKKNEEIYLTEGNQIRDFIHIDDVVSCLLMLLQKDELPRYMDFPLGTGTGVPVRHIVEYLKEITHSESELCFGAIPKRINEPDSVACREKMDEYGFQPVYDWKAGMKKFVYEMEERKL